MNKYLIIAPSWVGDMVMSQSLYISLKNKDPNCIIDIAAPEHCCELAQFMPQVRKAITLKFKRGKLGLHNRYKTAQTLKAEGYTHSIILPNSWKSALVPFFAKIKTRIGWNGEARFILLNDRRKLNKAKYQLMIERFIALALDKKLKLNTNLPWPKFTFNKNQVDSLNKKFTLKEHKKIIALCPGAEFGPAKKWPTLHYAQLAKYLLDKGYQVILLGGPKDNVTTSEIIKHSNSDNIIDLAGKTTIPEAVQLIAKCHHVISNDSGLMHIACATGVTTTVIYGSTSDRFTPPLSTNAKSVYLSNLPCRPCFQRTCPLNHMDCMNKLSVETVIDHFEQQQLKTEV